MTHSPHQVSAQGTPLVSSGAQPILEHSTKFLLTRREREILLGLEGLGKGDFWEVFLYCYLQGDRSSWGRLVKQISPR